jgi:hypothetical protein
MSGARGQEPGASNGERPDRDPDLSTKVSVPGTWFLEPDACNGAAVHASLLPSLFQESGIRCQDDAWPDLAPAHYARQGLAGILLPDP